MSTNIIRVLSPVTVIDEKLFKKDKKKKRNCVDNGCYRKDILRVFCFHTLGEKYDRVYSFQRLKKKQMKGQQRVVGKCIPKYITS